MSILKRIFKAVMILLLILFIAISIFFLTFDLNSYKGIITSKASEALGRPVTINSMSMKLSLIPTVEIKGIKIVNNAEFKDDAPLLEIDSVDATLALLPLLQSKVEIKSFNMATAKVNLLDKNGQNNYTLGSSDASVAAQPVQTAQSAETDKKDIFKTVSDVLNRLSIDTIAIKTLLVTHKQDDKKQVLALMDVSVEQLKLVKMTIIYNGKTVKAEVNLGDFASFMSRRPNYSFSAVFDAFDARMELSGTIGDTINFDNMLFNLSIEGKDLKKIVDNFVKLDKVPAKEFSLKLIAKGDLSSQLKVYPITVILGENEATLSADMTLADLKKEAQIALTADVQITDAKLARLYGIKPMSASVDMIGNMQNITLNKLMLSGGKSDILMNGLVSLTDSVPAIKTQIVSRYFDINDFIAHAESVAKKQNEMADAQDKSAPLFSDAKIDFSALKRVNAEFAATAQYIKVPQIDNIGMAVAGKLVNGNLAVDSLTVRTPAGSIKGGASLNASQIPATIQLNMLSEELDLDAIKLIAEQVQGVNALTDLKLSTRGDSIKSFANNLNGQVMLEITKGEILNKWFNSLPIAMGLLENKSSGMNFAFTEQNSELICGAVNLSVKDGVITSDNQIAIETSVVDFAVSGTVDLPKEELSLTMVPSVSNAKSVVQEALALTKIVKISGPFAQPAFSVDTKTAVQTAVKGGLTALANKVVEQQGIQLPISQNTGNVHLCERVLGRPLTGQTAIRVAQPVQEKKIEPQETTPAVDAKDMIKQQLLDSLTKALKK